MTPTWYDLLGVEPTASPEEIRAAWRSGIAELDPGERRFRSLNEAAEVLLDADRRAAYDATLEPEEPEPAAVADDEATPEPEREPEPEDEPVAATEADPEPAAPAVPAGRGVAGWVLAVLAVLTVLMVVAAGYLLNQPSEEAIAASTSDAQGAAERSVVTILSYDYREMDQDQQAAGELMTADYRKKDFDPLFEQIKANAPDLKIVVSVDTPVVASGIVRSGEDRVQVLVFINRETTRADLEQPVTSRDQVRLTMVRSGGDWLVDDMQTSPTAS